MRRGRQGGALIYRCRVSSAWPVGCEHLVQEQAMRTSPCDTREPLRLAGRSSARVRPRDIRTLPGRYLDQLVGTPFAFVCRYAIARIC